MNRLNRKNFEKTQPPAFTVFSGGVDYSCKECKEQQEQLEQYEALLEEAWDAGCETGKEVEQGYLYTKSFEEWKKERGLK